MHRKRLLPLAAEAHHHHGDSTTTPKLQLDAGQKRATDAALRQSMGNINQAMATALPLIHTGRFSQADHAALATTINQKIAYAIEHRKLEAKADAMLHLVIAELIKHVLRSAVQSRRAHRAPTSRKLTHR